MTVERLIVRGDMSLLARGSENSVGLWLGNFRSKDVHVSDADVQGMRTGIASPFFINNGSEPGRGKGTLLIEQSRLRTQIGVAIGTAYVAERNGAAPAKRAEVRGLLFEALSTGNGPAPEAVSMNDGMAASDARPREPIDVRDFNRVPGDDFRVYYSNQAPASVAPCHDTRPGVGGWVCR